MVVIDRNRPELGIKFGQPGAIFYCDLSTFTTRNGSPNSRAAMKRDLLVTPDCSHCERKRAFSRSFR